MSFSSRAQNQASTIIQDADVIDVSLDNEGDNLSATQVGSNKTLGNLGEHFALRKILGEKNRRHGAGKFNGPDISLSGTITSSGTAVTGSGTAFTTQLAVGDWIAGTAFEYREVQSITNDTSLTLVSAFSADIAVAQAAVRMQFAAERFDTFAASMRGVITGGLIKNGNNPPSVVSGTYNVLTKVVQVAADITGTFVSSSLGDTAIANNYWYYTLLNSSGTMKTHLAYGSSVLSTTPIQSIASAGGSSWDIRVLNAVSLASLSVGNVAMVTSATAGANNGVFVVSAFSDTNDSGGAGYKKITVTNSSGVAQAGVAGSISVYHRIAANDTAGNTSINTPAPTYSSAYAGYYSDYDPTYRIIGHYFSNGSGVVQFVTSYGNAYRKNDDYLEADTSAGFAGTDTKIFKAFTNTRRQWGSNIILTDNAGNGRIITFARSGTVKLHFSGSGASAAFGVTRDDTELTTNIQSKTQLLEVMTIVSVSVSTYATTSCEFFVDTSSSVRLHGDGVDISNAFLRLSFAPL